MKIHFSFLYITGTYRIIKDIAMSLNKPWVVVYMQGKTDCAVRALMYKINNEFPQCNIGAIVDLDKPGLDMMKTLLVNGCWKLFNVLLFR